MEMCFAKGRTVVVVTNRVDGVVGVTENLVVLGDGGRVVASGGVDEVVAVAERDVVVKEAIVAGGGRSLLEGVTGKDGIEIDVGDEIDEIKGRDGHVEVQVGKATVKPKLDAAPPSKASLDAYKFYLLSAGGFGSGIMMIGSIVIAYFCGVLHDFMLKSWSEKSNDQTIWPLVIYVGTVVLAITALYLRFIYQIHFSTKASSNIYTATFSRLLNAPLSHFDATPSGNMMNRFGKDTQVLDQEVASSIGETIQQVIHGIVVTTMISLASPFLLLFTIPIGIIYTPIARKFLSVQRSLKRLESGSRSPIYSAFGESLQGAVTIRAFGKTDVWMSQMMETLDVNHRAFLPLWAANRWLAGRVETVGALVAFGTGLSIAFAVSERGGGVRMDPGWAGLLLNYSGMFTDVLTWLVRNSAQMEMTMTSVERLLEYTKLKQERPAVVENYPVPESWPTNGSVAFDHLGIQYQTNEESEAGGSFAVDITSRIQIAAGESVGVVGRTGSGKSTLGMSLVRFEEYAHGTVWIDGVDIAVIGLKYLRQKLVVVPQDPFLFQGTVQLNLDPTSSYTPSEIENAFRFAKSN